MTIIERRFEYSHGSGIETVRQNFEKDGTLKSETTLRVKWDEIPFGDEWQAKYGHLTRSPFLEYAK